MNLRIRNSEPSPLTVPMKIFMLAELSPHGRPFVLHFFLLLMKKKLCSMCLVTQLCQGKVAAEIKIVALNRLVLVLGTDCCNSKMALRLLKRCVLEIVTTFTAHQAHFAHFPLLNSCCLGSYPLAAGFHIKNVIWIASV